MSQLTPKLEQAIRAVGDFMEAQDRDGFDPNTSAEDSLKSIVDRFNTVGTKVYDAAFKEAGLSPFNLADTASFRANMRLLVNLAQLNGSDAADKIIAVVKREAELAEKCPELKGLSGDTPEAVKKILTISKKSGLHW